MVVQVRELNRLTHRHSVCHAQNVEIRDGIVTVLQRNYIVPYLAFIISGQNFSFKTGIVDSEIISSPVPAVSAACGFAVEGGSLSEDSSQKSLSWKYGLNGRGKEYNGNIRTVVGDKTSRS